MVEKIVKSVQEIRPADKKHISEEDLQRTVNNYVLFTQIDVAIEDAAFGQIRIGKEESRFVKPLLIARNIVKQALLPAAFAHDMQEIEKLMKQQDAEEKK